MAVYLLHYDRPLMRGEREVRHYVGWCLDRNLERRVWQHTTGRGHSAFTEAMARIGSRPTVAYVIWGASRTSERALKRNGHHIRRCPICHPTLVGTELPDEYFAPTPYARVPTVPSSVRVRPTDGSLSPLSPAPAAHSLRPGRKRTTGMSSKPSQKVEVRNGG